MWPKQSSDCESVSVDLPLTTQSSKSSVQITMHEIQQSTPLTTSDFLSVSIDKRTILSFFKVS